MGRLIQFQTAPMNIMLSLREQIKRRDIWITEEFDGPSGKLVVADISWPVGTIRATETEQKTITRRLPFNTEQFLEYLTIKRVQLVQPVKLKLASINGLKQTGTGAPTNTINVDANLIFALNVFNTSTHEVFLSIRFEKTEGLTGVPGLDQIEKRIAKRFPTQTLPLDIARLTGLEQRRSIANVGIAAAPMPDDEAQPWSISDPQHHVEEMKKFSFLVIRIEVGNPPTSSEPWEQFYDHTEQVVFRGNWTSDTLKWAIFTDEFFIREAVRQGIETSLETSDKFALKSSPTAAWTAADASHGHVHIDFFGDATNACDLGEFGTKKIGLKVNVRVEVSAIGPPGAWPRDFDPGSLHQFVKINHWKDDLDTAICIAGVAAIWPYLGPKLMLDEDDNVDINWFEMAVGFIGPLLVIGALIEANKGGRLQSPVPECVRPDSEKDEFNCTRRFDAGDLAFGGLPELQELQARVDGAVLSGQVFWRKRLGRGFSLTAINVQPFKVAPQHFNCNQIGSVLLARITSSPKSFTFYEGSVTVEFQPDPLSAENETDVAGTSSSIVDLIPSRFVSVRVRAEDDPLNVFAPYVTTDDSSPFFKTIVIRVPLSAVPNRYFNAPYPCHVLIQTTAGTRMVQLPALNRVTAEEAKSVALEAWARRVSVCYAKSQRYDPRWAIDPPDFYLRRHRWQIAAAGLEPNEQIALERVEMPDQGQVASVRADRDGLARLSVNLNPDAYSGQLAFRRFARSHNARHESPDTDNVHELETRQIPAIDLKQTELLLVSQIAIDKSFVSVTPIVVENRLLLAVLTTRAIAFYDLTAPNQPTLLVRRSMSGVSGIVVRENRIFASGCGGVFRLFLDLEVGDLSCEPSSDCVETPSDAEPEPIIRLNDLFIEVDRASSRLNVFKEGRIARD